MRQKEGAPVEAVGDGAAAGHELQQEVQDLQRHAQRRRVHHPEQLRRMLIYHLLHLWQSGGVREASASVHGLPHLSPHRPWAPSCQASTCTARQGVFAAHAALAPKSQGGAQGCAARQGKAVAGGGEGAPRRRRRRGRRGGRPPPGRPACAHPPPQPAAAIKWTRHLQMQLFKRICVRSQHITCSVNEHGLGVARCARRGDKPQIRGQLQL